MLRVLLYSNLCLHIALAWLMGPCSHRKCGLASESWKTSLAPFLPAWGGYVLGGVVYDAIVVQCAVFLGGHELGLELPSQCAVQMLIVPHTLCWGRCL